MDVVVLGAGVLGRRLVSHSFALGCESCFLLPTDVTDSRALLESLAALKPDLVINTAAKTGVDWCETNPVEALRVNAVGAGIAAYVVGKGAHFVQISTDYVFPGRSLEGYTYTDEPYPINVYGASKLFGEQAVSALGRRNSTIVRLGWLYGVEYPQCAPMLARDSYEWSRGDLKGHHRPYIWDDLWGTPTFVGDAASVILAGRDAYQDLPQVMHLGPLEDPISWYDFLVKDFPDIRRAHAKNSPLKAQRPKRGGLIPNPPFALPSYEESLQQFIREAEHYDGQHQGA